MNINRTYYLIAYDISDSNRLKQIHKKIEAYAVSGQKSFYECWLTDNEFSHFKQEINEIIDVIKDKIIIFQLPQYTKPLLFGKAVRQSTQPFFII